MLNFCTLFDLRYLSRGLALHASLRQHATKFRLYVLAMDTGSLDFLKQLNYPDLIPISLADFETNALIHARLHRTRQEYCWTCTPSLIKYCLEKYALSECTYLDADIFFFADPKILLDEMQDQSVLITKHGYAPEYDQSATSGIYCVQFVTFRNNVAGNKILNTWAQQCIEWCFARYEDGKFGDQKYLDKWAETYPQVHVLLNSGGGLAPWNLRKFDLFYDAEKLKIQDIKTREQNQVVFYHFHDFYFDDNGNWFHRSSMPAYFIGEDAYQWIYRRYLEQLYSLREIFGLIAGVDFPRIPANIPWDDFEFTIIPRTLLLTNREILRHFYKKTGKKYELSEVSEDDLRKIFCILLDSGYNLSSSTLWRNLHNRIFQEHNHLRNRLEKVENHFLIAPLLSIYRLAKKLRLH